MKRIAINAGGSYVPGLNAVVAGTALAACELGWEVVGIRDGFEGLLFRDRYPDGGLRRIVPDRVAGPAETADTYPELPTQTPFAYARSRSTRATWKGSRR